MELLLPRSELAREIKERRERAGLSQDELGRLAGITSRGYISKVEGGKKGLDIGSVVAIALALGAPLSAFLVKENLPYLWRALEADLLARAADSEEARDLAAELIAAAEGPGVEAFFGGEVEREDRVQVAFSMVRRRTSLAPSVRNEVERILSVWRDGKSSTPLSDSADRPLSAPSRRIRRP